MELGLYIKWTKLYLKTQAAFRKKYKRTPKPFLKKRKKAIDKYFKTVTRAQIIKNWNEVNPHNKIY